MKKSILKSEIKRITPEKKSRFHMPGHKGRGVDFNWADYDITEIPGADNLHNADGIIAETQVKLAAVYGSEQAAILVNGSTTGIQSAILGTCNSGDELLVALNCHRSVFGALALGRIKGRFIVPEIDQEFNFASAILSEDIEKALVMYPEVKGLVLVNPSYYGTVSDLEKIAACLHQKGKFMIVDEAHGAQLQFAKGYAQTALKAGADLVIQSTHKVLGSFTQSALIHGQGKLIDWNRIKMFLALLQSSSPSYPLMISVEEATDKACLKGTAVFEMIKRKHQLFCADQKETDMLRLYNGQSQKYGYDYSKWYFSTGDFKGTEIEKRIAEEYGIQCEMSDQQSILFMTGLETTEADLDGLIAVIKDLNEKLGKRSIRKDDLFGQKNQLELNSELPIWEGLWAKDKEKVSLKESIGLIASDFIIPYPPGIPFLIPGTRMTEEKMQWIKSWLDAGVSVVGIDANEQLMMIKDEK